MRAVGDIDPGDFGVIRDERVADDAPPASPGGAVFVGMIVEGDIVSEIESFEEHSFCIGCIEIVVLAE